MGRPLLLTPELQEALCSHLAQGAHVKTACEAVGISVHTFEVDGASTIARDEVSFTAPLGYWAVLRIGTCWRAT